MQNFLRKTMMVFFFLNVKYYYISASVYNSGADTTSRPLWVRYCSAAIFVSNPDLLLSVLNVISFPVVKSYTSVIFTPVFKEITAQLKLN